MMLIRMLLKSCATPPASRPMASSFCDCRSCSSSARRSVMSRMKPVMTARLSPRMRATVNSTGNSVPSARIAVSSRRRAASGPPPVSMYWLSASSCIWRSAAGTSRLDVAAQDVGPRVAEHLLGGRIEFADVQVRIHRDDGVVRGLENRALARLALAPGPVHLVGQVQRRRREQQRQPVAGALGDRDDDGGRRGTEQIAWRARREVGLPDAPRALLRRQRDRDRNRHRVDEEVGERHAGERHDDDPQVGRRRAAQPLVHLTGGLDGQHQHRHVEQRAVRGRPRSGVQRRLAPAAGGADDHRGVRPAQDQRRDVDDVGHRHVRAAGDRQVDLEGRRQRRQQDQEEQREDRGERGARQEHHERDGTERDDREDVPAGAGRQISEQTRQV